MAYEYGGLSLESRLNGESFESFLDFLAFFFAGGLLLVVLILLVLEAGVAETEIDSWWFWKEGFGGGTISSGL